jgi:inorganic pyrophosphatase
MIDEGECDWKVVAIDKDDKWAPFLNDIQDVENEWPGMLSSIREWYRTYKIPDGKPPNVFGLDEQFMDKQYTLAVIEECHTAWEELMSGHKERHLEQQDEEVRKLVRVLSKNSLFVMAENLDEHSEREKLHDGEAGVGGGFLLPVVNNDNYLNEGGPLDF